MPNHSEGTAEIEAAFVAKVAWTYRSNAERRTFIDGFYETMTKQGLARTRHVQTATVLSPEADGSVTGVLRVLRSRVSGL